MIERGTSLGWVRGKGSRETDKSSMGRLFTI
jgi:hypothetical protein